MKRPFDSTLRLDALMGSMLALVAELELLVLDPGEVTGTPAAHHALNLLIAPCVALRRFSPAASIALACLGFAVQPLVGSAPVAMPYLVLLFLLASLGWCAPLKKGAALVLLVLVCGIGVDAVTNEVRGADIVVNAAVIVGAWGAAYAVRRATDRRVHAELEADRAARAATEAERTRIGQDLHDSLAHALTLMILQAGSARERLRDPAIIDVLASIERGGREALTDMHRFLGLLGPRADEAPGLADLDDLLESVRRAGLDVRLEIDHGLAVALPPSASTTIYRVVQEALTNVLRHSDATTARVLVGRRGNDVVVEVTDDGRPVDSKTAGAGGGLAGLRSRLALFDGSLTSSQTRRGWRLEATIPFAAGAAR